MKVDRDAFPPLSKEQPVELDKSVLSNTNNLSHKEDTPSPAPLQQNAGALLLTQPAKITWRTPMQSEDELTKMMPSNQQNKVGPKDADPTMDEQEIPGSSKWPMCEGCAADLRFKEDSDAEVVAVTGDGKRSRSSDNVALTSTNTGAVPKKKAPSDSKKSPCKHGPTPKL